MQLSYKAQRLTIAGHQTSECTSKRLLDKSDLPEMDAEAAWDMLQKADEDRDLDDFRTVSRLAHFPSMTS